MLESRDVQFSTKVLWCALVWCGIVRRSVVWSGVLCGNRGHQGCQYPNNPVTPQLHRLKFNPRSDTLGILFVHIYKRDKNSFCVPSCSFLLQIRRSSITYSSQSLYNIRVPCKFVALSSNQKQMLGRDTWRIVRDATRDATSLHEIPRDALVRRFKVRA